MKTVKIGTSAESIQKAADIIRQGELVAFPTETVYGLGANGLDVQAVGKIFTAKGRPQDNPLILHIADREDLAALVTHIPPQADALVEAFWPGPLTLIFEAADIVPEAVTAGGKTVAVRMPAHPVALDLIKASGVPLAAPSANVSGRPSPTDADTVLTDLDGRIPIILDGGRTRIGLESTVLDLTTRPPMILRPGFITEEDLAPVIGPVAVDPQLKGQTPRSPGQKYRHYAPKAAVVIVEPYDVKAVLWEQSKRQESGQRVLALLFDEDFTGAGDTAGLGSAADLSQMAHVLYKRLREADTAGYDVVVMPGVPRQGWGTAIMNRLDKAAGRTER